MTDLLEMVLTMIGFICILSYILYLDYKMEKLKSENRELRHKIQTRESR